MTGTAVAESPTTGAEDVLLLYELAEGVKREHEAASQTVRQSLAHARTAGEMLLEAKAKIPHGGFMKWVAEECRMSHRTASGSWRKQ